MQKKSSHPSLLLPHPPKLQREQVLRQGELLQLFGPPYSECFELEYLRHSPHMQSSQAYRELVTLLQHYNEDTTAGLNPNNRVQAACMRLIFREMLSMAVMEERELRENDLAGKLQKWYYGLNEHHSFLEGVAFSKKKNREDEARLEQLIRQSYLSNVYDEYPCRHAESKTTAASWPSSPTPSRPPRPPPPSPSPTSTPSSTNARRPSCATTARSASTASTSTPCSPTRTDCGRPR